MIGQTLSHYRIISKLGEGGMGAVYLAEDTTLGRKVAIKFPQETSDSQHFRARFLLEARAASLLSNPHIATIYDYGETGDGHPFIVMELITGPSLSDLLHNGGLTLQRSVKIVEAIAEALSDAHRHGIIHRDIKPSNIALDERDEVKVLDFGLAKQIQEELPGAYDTEAQTLLGAHTRSGVVVGTPLYLSPEQAMSTPVDRRSDLFTLGALLYECITGRPPFVGSTVIEIAAQVIHVTPPAPSTINPRVPSELDRVTMKALAKKPEARYQSAEEFIEDLKAVQADLREGSESRTQRVAIPRSKMGESALATISNMMRRPRISVFTMMAVAAILLTGVWVASRFWKAKLHQPSAEALRWYKDGTDALRDGAYYTASKRLEQSIKADNGYALAHARLAEAWSELDYADKAKDEILIANSLVPERSVLPDLDAKYFQAITNMVSHNFPGAVANYQEIVRAVPDEEKAYAYVDLGRAYEKSEDWKKAIESYLEAANRAPQYSAPFLRAGIIYARQQNIQSANASFEKAEKIYQAQSNFEGVAGVLYQRSTLLVQMGKVAEAHAQLQKSLDITHTINNLSQQIMTLLQLSSVFYLEGDTAQAERSASEAVDLARSNGMESLTARGLVNLGNVFFVKGNYEQAEKYFRQALESAQRYKGLYNEARARGMLGSTRIQQGRADEALEFLEPALALYQQGGWNKERSQILLLIGRAKRLKGDYDGALRAFEEQLQLALQVGDASQQAFAHSSIGITLGLQEQYAEALRHFEESYRINKSLDAKFNIEYDLVNRGEMFWQVGRYSEAQAALDEALSAASRPDSNYKGLLAEIYLLQARMALSKRLFAEAKTKSQQSLSAAGGQKDVAVEAKQTLCLSQLFGGAKGQGRQLCEEAFAAASQEGNPRLLGGAQLALAQAMLETDDAQGALNHTLRAQETFARTGQQDSEWRAWLIAALASRRAADEAKAREYALHAADLLTKLQQKLGDDGSKGYLARPDVGYARKQLDEINTLK